MQQSSFENNSLCIVMGLNLLPACVFVQTDGEDGRLFQWHDGPLVLAMKEGGVFLMDEISLADDSVLERLNRYKST